MILFDIRSDDGYSGFIEVVNRDFGNIPGNPYLARFGHVCSRRWWECFDSGELPAKMLTGTVSHVGPREDEYGETEDVVEFDCDGGGFAYDGIDHRVAQFACNGRAVAYDRIDRWASQPIRIGDRISITYTEADLHTPTGPVRYLIDLRAEWSPSADGPAF